MKPASFATRLVQFDRAPDDPFRPMCTPIYLTASFEQDSPEQFSRFDYSRSGNPTRSVLERQLASLEGATTALAFNSGMAALHAVASLLRPGDEIVAGDDLYGGTFRLFSAVLASRGVGVRYEDLRDPTAVASKLGPRTRLVHVETPSNPRLEVYDIGALAAAARGAGVLLCVDSTAMSPLLQRPLEHGADLVVHSATKFLGGHGDTTAGIVAVRDANLGERLAFDHNACGAALPPFDSYLLLRGLKTLAIRLQRQQQSAGEIAHVLAGLIGPEHVFFPGLPTHAGYQTHRRQAEGSGALISVDLGTPESARAFVESLTYFPVAVSFGSAMSSCVIPAYMSHRSIPAKVAQRRPLPHSLVRLSIGIEDSADLLADIRQAHGAAACRSRSREPDSGILAEGGRS